jgi:four helix bundle protein
LARQLLRSGTSVAANIAEAIGSISKREFTAKTSIAYKETRETKYWLDLLLDTRDLGDKKHSEHFKDVDEIGGMLYSAIKKCRE